MTFFRTTAAVLLAALGLHVAPAARAEGTVPEPATITTSITSDRLDFDYEQYTAFFEGHVHVDDPQFTLASDQLVVYFERTNDVTRIEAIGHVVATQKDPKAAPGQLATARGHHAIYVRQTGTLTLTGTADSLPVLTKGRNSASGEKVTVYLDKQTVKVERRVKLTGYRAGRKDPTVITARTLDYEYETEIATLDGGVHVADPDFTLDSNAMIVCLQRGQGFKRIDAAGNVRGSARNYRLTCGKASYTRAKGVIELSRGSGIPGGTPVVSWDENSLSANTITVWPQSTYLTADGSVVIKAVSADETGARQTTTARAAHLELTFPSQDRIKGKLDGVGEYTALMTDQFVLTSPTLKVTSDKALVNYEFKDKPSAQKAGARNLVRKIEAIGFSKSDLAANHLRSVHRNTFEYTDKNGKKFGECDHFYYHRDAKESLSLPLSDGTSRSIDVPARSMHLHGDPVVRRDNGDKIDAPLIIIDLPNNKVRTPWGIHSNTATGDMK